MSSAVYFTGKYIDAIYFKYFLTSYIETKNLKNVCFSDRRNFLTSEQFLHGVLSWGDSLALISSYHWILFAFEDMKFVKSRAVLRSVSKKRIPGAVTVIPHLLEHLTVAFPFPQFMTELPVSRLCFWSAWVKSHAWSCHFILALIQHSTTPLIVISPAYFWCENKAIVLKTFP